MTLRILRPALAGALALLTAAGASSPARAQQGRPAAAGAAATETLAPASDLDSLVSRAVAVNPSIRAAADRVEAARAAVGPAGALPDPMLSVGVTNLPVSEPGFSDFMTMKMVGIGQTLPYPGKLGLRRRIAAAVVSAAEADLAAARLDVEAEVRQAYYELAFHDRALEILRRNEALLANFTRATQARYGVGAGTQADVLKSRVESGRLAEEASRLVEARRAALARLNAALGRPSDTPVQRPAVPERIARAAVANSATEIHFVSADLGARATDSRLAPLAELQEDAIQNSPAIHHHEAMIAAQAARVELAGKAYLPDFDVSIQYGQRADRMDMVSAMVSVPLPLHKGSKQDLELEQAQAELSALRAEHHDRANAIRAKVAELYSGLEQDRAQLALFVKSILPQGRAALESATAGFRVGRVDFLTLVDNQATLYNYETQYYRSLTDFAEKLAELERTVGKEILR
jgi:outer membrane protein TolC